MDEFLVISKNCLQTQGYLALHEKFPYSEFSGPYFSAFGLNTERWRDIQYVSVVSPNAGKYGPGKLRIRTLFTQCRNLPNIYGGAVLRKIVKGF